MDEIKKKKNKVILIFLLSVLILSRVALYFVFGFGILGTDANTRYLPQMEELSYSIKNIYFQTGPAYSLFLLLFNQITGDIVFGPVLLQHILGVITAILIFFYFKKINIYLSAITSFFVYCSWISLWLEHSILRESLVAFFFVLLVLFLSCLFKRRKGPFDRLNISLAGLIGLVLIFLRMELLFLVFFLPFAILIAKRKDSIILEIKKYFKHLSFYFLLIIIILSIFIFTYPKENNQKFQYSSLFGISYYTTVYHDFFPEVFYYEGSKYPELVNSYKLINISEFIDERDKAGKIVSMIKGTTEEYLSNNPQINLSANQLMDKVFLEMIKNNRLNYFKLLATNFKSHLLGMAELRTVSRKSDQFFLLKIHLSGQEPTKIETVPEKSLSDIALWLYLKFMIIFNQLIFWLFLASMPILFLKWKIMPEKIIIAFLIAFFHLFILSMFADPSHRFRYIIDPFLYFLQFYLIFYFLVEIKKRLVRLI